MTRDILIKWAIAAMTGAQPPAATPWADTYPATAEVFATVALDTPLFPGPDGAQEMMSWLVSTSWFEGRFDPKAKGDGKCVEKKNVCRDRSKPGDPPELQCKEVCVKKGPPQSFCMFQIGVSNFDYLKVTEETILGSTEVCTRSAVTMMKMSINKCRSHPKDEWLGHYASGGDTCGGLMESRHRVNKAKWLFANVKTPE